MTRLNFFLLIESFFATWVLMYLGWLETGDLLNGVFFLLCFLFFRYSTQYQAKAQANISINTRADMRANPPEAAPENMPKRKTLTKKIARRTTGFASLMAVFLTLLSFTTPTLILWKIPALRHDLENPLFLLIFLGAVAVGFFFLYFHVLRFLFAVMTDKKRSLGWLTGNTQTASSRPAVHFSRFRIFSRFQIFSRFRIFFRLRILSRLPGFYDRHLGSVTFLCCILGFLPYFLYLYPGVLTPDGLNQLRQVMGVVPYSNHHPIVHTLLIGLCYHFGRLFTSDLTVVVSFYTFFQMCTMAAVAAFLIKTVRKLKVRRLICVLMTGVYALVPYHAIYAVTIWKDVLFSAAVLLFAVALLRLYLETRNHSNFIGSVPVGGNDIDSVQDDSDSACSTQDDHNDDDSACSVHDGRKDDSAASGSTAPTGRITPGSLVLYIFSGLMLCLFRSNGWYAFLLSLPFLIYFFRSVKKIMLPVQIGLLLTVLLIKGPIMDAFQVEQPDLVENLSIPLQQIAYVIYEDRELSPSQRELIDAVMDSTHVKELYDANISDNIKELVRAGHPEYLAAHRWEYLKLWIDLGLSYPLDYLTAYVNQTYGYWYPSGSYEVAQNEGISPTSLPIFHTPLIRGPVVVKLKEIALKLREIIPLYGLIWNIGTLFWVLLFLVGCTVLRRERWKLILYLPVLAIMATLMIATPVADDFRYAYPLVYTMPFYLIIALWRPEA